MNESKDDVVEETKLEVELIYKLLGVAPSAYYAARGRVLFAGALNDVTFSSQLFDLWEGNFHVYGAAQTLESSSSGRYQHWSRPDRASHENPRSEECPAVETGEKKIAGPRATRRPDLVKKVFAADVPSQVWVTDLTFVHTWAASLMCASSLTPISG